jgi:4-hydroxybenzoate polyprenyltransferase
MMDLPWIILTLVAIVAFSIFEAMAFRHPDRLNTLSRSIATLGAKWPLSIFLMGLFAGILAAHLFWPWASNPLGAGGG